MKSPRRSWRKCTRQRPAAEALADLQFAHCFTKSQKRQPTGDEILEDDPYSVPQLRHGWRMPFVLSIKHLDAMSRSNPNQNSHKKHCSPTALVTMPPWTFTAPSTWPTTEAVCVRDPYCEEPDQTRLAI